MGHIVNPIIFRVGIIKSGVKWISKWFLNLQNKVLNLKFIFNDYIIINYIFNFLKFLKKIQKNQSKNILINNFKYLILYYFFYLLFLFVWTSIGNKLYSIMYLNLNQTHQLKINFHYLLVTKHNGWLWCHAFTTKKLSGCVKISDKSINGDNREQHLKTDMIYKIPINYENQQLIEVEQSETYLKEFFEGIESASNLKDAIEKEYTLPMSIKYNILKIK